ncbi:uncharacterized protein LOC117106810 [Anneissia japonica]|uniref:uncharacterized protein LOC117106810 n=1 Tax=Anneissia japonica TaxID=1529436 RepID=UPI0014258DE8|nr:uncharacterized protein LOC117106810 [Anneissia japonica]
MIRFAIALLAIVAVVEAKHFRGGSFSWKPRAGGKVKISWKVNWMRYYEGMTKFLCTDEVAHIAGEGNLICMECQEKLIYGKELDLNCTSWSEEENWTSGIGSFLYTPEPGMKQFTLSYQESQLPNEFNFNSQWMSELKNYGGAGNAWRMVSVVDLTIPNSSPKTTHPAMISVVKECGDVSIYIPVSDQDDDKIRCRWSTKPNECPDVACSRGRCGRNKLCGDPVENAVMEANRCKYTFPVTEMEAGWYAVPITIEDFRPGVTGALEGGALSKVPLQFLLRVESKGECRLLDFGDNLQRCHLLRPGEPWSYEIKAYSEAEMKVLVIERPSAAFKIGKMTKFEDYQSRTVSWTPEEDDIGKHFILFHSVDVDGFYSSYETLTLLVKNKFPPGFGDPPAGPQIIKEESFPKPMSTAEVQDKFWSIKFDLPFNRPTKPVFININDMAGNPVLQIDVSDKSQVEVDPDDPTRIRFPNQYKQLIPGTMYSMEPDEGINFVECLDACGMECPPITTPKMKWLFRLMAIPTPSVDCGPSSMTVYIPKLYVDDMNPNLLRFIDAWSKHCRATKFNTTHYIMTTDFDDCGTRVVEPKPKRLVFKNKIRDAPKPYGGKKSQITREKRKFRINVECEVKGTYFYDVTFTPNDTLKGIRLTGRSELKAMLKMYKDEGYGTEVNKKKLPLPVKINKRLYFSVEGVNRNKELQIDNCYAVPRNKPPGCKVSPHVLIEDGCPVDRTLQMEPSNVQSVKKFSVRSFAFIYYGLSEDVHIRCQTAVCDSGNGNSKCAKLASKQCSQYANSNPLRGKRDVGYTETDELVDVMLEVIG